MVHRGARDLLPQGRPREGRHRPGDGVQGLGLVPGRRSQTIKDKVPSTASRSRRSARPARRRSTSSTTSCRSCGTPAAPSSRRDDKKSTINSPAGRAGRGVHGRPDPGRACPTRASSSVTARRSRTSSRAAASPSGSAARGCSARSGAPTTTNWVPTARKNVGVAPMPPARARRYTFVGGSNLMMLKSTKHPNEAWALMKYLSGDAVQKEYVRAQYQIRGGVQAADAEPLRGPDAHVHL